MTEWMAMDPRREGRFCSTFPNCPTYCYMYISNLRMWLHHSRAMLLRAVSRVLRTKTPAANVYAWGKSRSINLPTSKIIASCFHSDKKSAAVINPGSEGSLRDSEAHER